MTEKQDWLWRNTNEAMKRRIEGRAPAPQTPLAAALERTFLEVRNWPRVEAWNQIAAVAEGRIADVLREHWLTGVECDHNAKTDVATCYCAVWRSEPLPSVGAAVDAWITHALDVASRSLYLREKP